MLHRSCIAVLGMSCGIVLAGCSSGDSTPKLVPVDGVVTYQGRPLPGATVTFSPKDGSPAFAMTDPDGKFSVSTGAFKGIAVGPVKVAVSATVPAADKPETSGALDKNPQSAEESAAFLMAAGEMQEKMVSDPASNAPPVSRIPERYMKADTSGLQFTINANGENHLKIELID